MFDDLKDKVVLLTDSNIGIGAATAKLFSSLGCKVVVTGRYEERINSVANECYQLSPYKYKPLTVVCDLMSEEPVKRLAQNTIDELGRIDVFVNNTSTFSQADSLSENVLSEFDSSTIGNNRCVIQLCNLLLPHLIESKGCIVNVSASPMNMYAIASMAKASLDTLSKNLAREFAPKGIRVNTVHVGGTLTESVLSHPYFEEWKNNFTPKVPLRRPGIGMLCGTQCNALNASECNALQCFGNKTTQQKKQKQHGCVLSIVSSRGLSTLQTSNSETKGSERRDNRWERLASRL